VKKLKKHNGVSEQPFSKSNIMESPIDERRAKVRQIVKRFEDRLRLSRASELASWGHLLAAEALLCPGIHLPMSADELDMLARIHVKQGRFDLARRRWEDAAKIGDRCTEFENCIKTLETWLEFKERMLIWRIKLGLCLSAILVSFWILHRLGLFSTIYPSS